MATISLTIPDAVVARVLDAVAAGYGYNAATHGTKAQFARQYLGSHLKQITVNYEANLAGSQATQAQRTASEAEVNIL